MGSFANVIITIMNNLGIGLIFLFLFYFAISYVTIRFLLESYVSSRGDKDKDVKNLIHAISLILGVSIGFFLSTFSGLLLFTQYFLSFVITTVLIFFFFLLIANIFTGGKVFEFSSSQLKDTSKDAAKYLPLIIFIFLVVFALLSLFYAYQDYFISLSLGTNPLSYFYYQTFNPYILFLVIFFILIGTGIILMGSGDSDSKESGGSSQKQEKK
ncbi:MAG: hypothetical protein ACP5G1_02125 [Nanopusillaceae archaeon]